MMPNLLYCFSNAVAPITKVLSQYELLKSVCEGLSSADIVHLAATCKEHRTYISSNKEILALLQSTAHCDGRGIVAQAHVFGYWSGDPSKAPADSKCLGADAKPCTECGAHVCNNCRFHFSYLQDVINWEEREWASDVEDQGMDRLSPSGGKLPDLCIESGKAFDVFWNHRRRTFCDPCEPLILGLDDQSHVCHCKFYKHFVGGRWLCLPCFFLEEAKAYQTTERKIIAYDPESPEARHRGAYVKVDVCDCGQLSRPKSLEVCRVCNGVHGWYADRKPDILAKIHAQLG